MPASRYFAFGNVAIDDLVYADGTTQWGVPGGGALYAALGMAVWTGAAAVVAPFGDDYPRERFTALDFSASRLLESTMRNWGLYEVDGSRQFLSRRDSLPWEAFSSAATDIGPGEYPYCHLAPLPWGRVRELVDELLTRGARLISLDLHERELAAVDSGELFALLERVHIFLPSRQDVAVLFPGRAPLDALRLLRDRLPRVPLIGVKCDVDGVLVHTAGRPDVAVVPPVGVRVVDATGAGDAFCGGFLAGFATAGDAVEAALYGTVAASFALDAVGPWALAGRLRREAQTRLTALRPWVRRVPLYATPGA